MAKKLNKPTFTAAFDDSGGIEALVTWDGTPIQGDHALTSLMGVFVNDIALESLHDDWNNLKLHIQNELALEYLPPIHMRLMWGKDVANRKFKGNIPNPYGQASFEQIKSWVDRAVEIIYSYKSKRSLSWIKSSINRKIVAETVQSPYFKDPRFLAELKFIRQHSRGKSKKMYRVYHNRITSPLLRGFTDILPYMNETMRILGAEELNVLVDSFADSHGVDSESVIATVKEQMNLGFINKIQIVNSNDFTLSEVADVLGNIWWRKEMIDGGFISDDKALRAIMVRHQTKRDILNVDISGITLRKYPELPTLSLTIHYSIARNALALVNPSFAEEHLVSPEEFYQRALKAKADKEHGIYVLKDYSVCKEIYQSLINDDDRGLSRGPDVSTL